MKNKIIENGIFSDKRAKIKYTPIRVKTMCPALMFAASRTDKVTGRTAVLTVSIKMRNGFNHEGAPPGKRDAKVVIGLKNTLDKINLSHSGRPKENVKIKCEDVLKT